MCIYSGSKDSEAFLKELKKLIDDGHPPINPGRTLAQFQKYIKRSSTAVIKDGAKYEFRSSDFGSGWMDGTFKWFIRHLINNRNDIEPARKIMLDYFERYEQKRLNSMPWSGGNVVPL